MLKLFLPVIANTLKNLIKISDRQTLKLVLKASLPIGVWLLIWIEGFINFWIIFLSFTRVIRRGMTLGNRTHGLLSNQRLNRLILLLLFDNFQFLLLFKVDCWVRTIFRPLFKWLSQLFLERWRYFVFLANERRCRCGVFIDSLHRDFLLLFLGLTQSFKWWLWNCLLTLASLSLWRSSAPFYRPFAFDQVLPFHHALWILPLYFLWLFCGSRLYCGAVKFLTLLERGVDEFNRVFRVDSVGCAAVS